MNVETLLEIHSKLWNQPTPDNIIYGGQVFEVDKRDNPRQKFNAIKVDHMLIITQNLHKSSPWTRKSLDEDVKITWVIYDGSGYEYRVESWTDPEDKNFVFKRVIQLKPQRLIHSVRERSSTSV